MKKMVLSLKVIPQSNSFKLSSFLLFILLSSVLFSCKKEDFKSGEEAGMVNMTKIRSNDVLTYLQQNTSPLTPKRNNFISKISENLLFDRMYSERLHGNENLIIVPLSDVYFSKNIDPGQHPIQYLILAQNTEGKIRKADLVLFFPKDQNLKSLPENSFTNFFDETAFTTDGTFTLINLFDVKQFDAKFENGNKTEFRLLKRQKEENLGETNCIAWYWVTTYYYEDGHTEQDWEYIGTTCQEDEQTTLEGGSGGSAPTEVTRGVDFTVHEEWSSGGYQHWQITAAFTLQGMTCGNASDNYFTGMSSNGTALISYTPAINGDPNNSSYQVYNPSTSITNWSSSTATGTAHCSITYPNNQNGPQTDPYGNSHTWTASIDLY